MDSVKSVNQFYSRKSQASDAAEVSCKNFSPYEERPGKYYFFMQMKKKKKGGGGGGRETDKNRPLSL